MTSTPVYFTSWRKSSFSSAGNNCVEVALTGWRTSSYSTAGQNCVEVGAGEGVVGIRDSKNPTGTPLALPHTAWQRFLSAHLTVTARTSC